MYLVMAYPITSKIWWEWMSRVWRTFPINVNVPTNAKSVIGEISNKDNFANHAWNECYINGKWISEDVTWDAGHVDNSNKFTFNYSNKYFNPDETDFEKDHYKRFEEDY